MKAIRGLRTSHIGGMAGGLFAVVVRVVGIGCSAGGGSCGFRLFDPYFNRHFTGFLEVHGQREFVANFQRLGQFHQHHMQLVVVAKNQSLAGRNLHAIDLEHAHYVVFHFHVVNFCVLGNIAAHGQDGVIAAALVLHAKVSRRTEHARAGRLGIGVNDREIASFYAMGLGGQAKEHGKSKQNGLNGFFHDGLSGKVKRGLTCRAQVECRFGILDRIGAGQTPDALGREWRWAWQWKACSTKGRPIKGALCPRCRGCLAGGRLGREGRRSRLRRQSVSGRGRELAGVDQRRLVEHISLSQRIDRTLHAVMQGQHLACMAEWAGWQPRECRFVLRCEYLALLLGDKCLDAGLCGLNPLHTTGRADQHAVCAGLRSVDDARMQHRPQNRQ